MLQVFYQIRYECYPNSVDYDTDNRFHSTGQSASLGEESGEMQLSAEDTAFIHETEGELQDSEIVAEHNAEEGGYFGK